jgi:hypothetical protein
MTVNMLVVILISTPYRDIADEFLITVRQMQHFFFFFLDFTRFFNPMYHEAAGSPSTVPYFNDYCGLNHIFGRSVQVTAIK